MFLFSFFYPLICFSFDKTPSIDFSSWLSQIFLHFIYLLICQAGKTLSPSPLAFLHSIQYKLVSLNTIYICQWLWFNRLLSWNSVNAMRAPSYLHFTHPYIHPRSEFIQVGNSFLYRPFTSHLLIWIGMESHVLQQQHYSSFHHLLWASCTNPKHIITATTIHHFHIISISSFHVVILSMFDSILFNFSYKLYHFLRTTNLWNPPCRLYFLFPNQTFF